MKNKSKLLKIATIILILLILTCLFNKSYGIVTTASVAGIGGVLVFVIQVVMVVLGLAGQLIMSGLATALSGFDINAASISLRKIIFNEIPATTASYFNSVGMAKETTITGTMVSIFDKVTDFYYIIRNLSIAALLLILLYIGIRMTISTVASEEAKYKKMLGNWLVSLATVFVLHYIMIITFYCNNTLVNILGRFTDSNKDLFFQSASLAATGIVPVAGLPQALIFLMCVGMELTFFIMYIKRVITLGFLIVIAPLITITYSIDKIGDGRSQALNAWLKEFIFTVIIQPFHCIIYLVLVQTVLQEMSGLDVEAIGSGVIYIIMLKFLKEAEGIIKKIFNIQSDSMPGASNMGAMALGLITSFAGKAAGKGKGGKGVGSNTKMPKMEKEKGASSSSGNGASGSAAGGSGGSSGATGGNKNQNSGQNKGSTQGKNNQQTRIQAALNNAGEKAKKLGEKAREIPIVDAGIQKAKEAGENINDLMDKAKENKIVAKGFETAQKAKEADLKAAGKLWTKVLGDEDVQKNLIKGAAKIGVAGAALGVGLGMADEKAALGAAMLAYSQANSIDDALQDHKNNVQLEKNEDAYKEEFRDYMGDYRAIYGQNISEQEIIDHTNKLFEMHDNNTLNIDELSDPEKRILGVYENIRDSYEIVGAEDPNDMVKRLNTRILFENQSSMANSGSQSSGTQSSSSQSSSTQSSSSQSSGSQSSNTQGNRYTQGSQNSSGGTQSNNRKRATVRRTSNSSKSKRSSQGGSNK